MVSPVGDDFFVVTNSVRPLLFIYPHIRYPHNVWHIVYHMARLHNLVIPQNLIALQTGCRGRQPLQLLQANLPCRKIASLFADFTLYKDIVKAVQSFVLRHRFVICFSLCFLFFFSAPLGRLAPIEALPQAPLGTLSLDPAMGFTP